MKPDSKDSFTEEQHELANMSKALGHPARLAILNFLIENNNQTCKSIVAVLPFSQSTVSQHLAELKSAGLIEGRSFKTSMIYSIDQEKLQEYLRVFRSVFKMGAEKKQLSLF